MLHQIGSMANGNPKLMKCLLQSLFIYVQWFERVWIVLRVTHDGRIVVDGGIVDQVQLQDSASFVRFLIETYPKQ